MTIKGGLISLCTTPDYTVISKNTYMFYEIRGNITGSNIPPSFLSFRFILKVLFLRYSFIATLR